MTAPLKRFLPRFTHAGSKLGPRSSKAFSSAAVFLELSQLGLAKLCFYWGSFLCAASFLWRSVSNVVPEEEELFVGRRSLVRPRVGLFTATSAASALLLYDALLLILLVDIMNSAVYGSSRIPLGRAFEGIAKEPFCMNM